MIIFWLFFNPTRPPNLQHHARITQAPFYHLPSPFSFWEKAQKGRPSDFGGKGGWGKKNSKKNFLGVVPNPTSKKPCPVGYSLRSDILSEDIQPFFFVPLPRFPPDRLYPLYFHEHTSPDLPRIVCTSFCNSPWSPVAARFFPVTDTFPQIPAVPLL